MRKILIFGAGSIGNHMTKACTSLGWKVFITDKNSEALKRMKFQIYPKRYKKWNSNIVQINFKNVFKLKDKFDIIIIGTPPITHYDIYEKCKKRIKFDKILIEKPISNYLDNKIFKIKKDLNKFYIFCGYNHTVNPSLEFFFKLLRYNKKNINSVFINWKEGWKGILGAHPWLKDEFDSYLGNFKKGGGAVQEHSHGLHILVNILKILSINNFIKINQKIFFKNKNNIKYDYFANLSFEMKKIFFKYETDLITIPAQKNIHIGLKNGYLKWICNYKQNQDLVIVDINGKEKKKKFMKTRSSEFINELIHIDKIKSKKQYNYSSINIYNALETFKTIKKIFKK